MKTYLYVCQQCSYHTATYELLVKCPSCLSSRKRFKLVATSEDDSIQEKISLIRAGRLQEVITALAEAADK